MAPVDQVVQGSISHGTLREEDLITAFLGELRRLDPERAAEEFENFQNDLQTEGIAASTGDITAQFLTELYDALEEYSPEGLYFGAHPGNGSDFGFWLVETE